MVNHLLLRVALSLTAVIAAAVILGGVLVFLGALTYFGLAEAMPVPAAAVLTTIAALIVVAIILAGGYRIARGRRPGVFNEDSLANELGRILGADVGEMVRKHPHQTLLGSLAAGFAVGASPRLREILRTLAVS